MKGIGAEIIGQADYIYIEITFEMWGTYSSLSSICELVGLYK